MSAKDDPSLTQTAVVGQPAAPTVQGFALEVTEGPDAGVRWRSEGSAAVIGSADSCDLILRDPTVSRFHCELRADDRGVRVLDTGSRNGTVVDGVRVVEAFVRAGALLRLGHTALRFDVRDDSVALPTSSATRLGLLTGASVAMRRVFAVLERAAATNATVLLEGETGTGKSAAARTIHQESERSAGPFVTVDCGALPPSLLESELFGHEKGAFTSADARRIGAFEEASGGTLFLDEIGELPIDLQPKLLGALENRAVRRVGGTGTVPVDVRLIAATNRDLRGAVNDGAFRMDLYYRLAVVRVELPPLRARDADVEPLARHLLASLGADHARIERLMTDAMIARLRGATWPGNVRELRNYLERCLVFDEPVELEPAIGPGAAPAIDLSLPFAEAKVRAQAEFEREYLTGLLERHGGVVVDAAAAAGIDRTHFHRLLRKHRLNR